MTRSCSRRSGSWPRPAEPAVATAGACSFRETMRETMSAANVDLVRRIYDALLQDDLDAALQFMDQEIEYVNPDYAVESGRRYGHEGIRANVENMRVSFDYWRFLPEEFI